MLYIIRYKENLEKQNSNIIYLTKTREIYEKKTNYVYGLSFPELRNGNGSN